MVEEITAGGTRPESQGTEEPEQAPMAQNNVIKKEETMIKVGQKMPDFSASAYFKGKFINFKLSDYLGKWIVLCFYPGDFTFV